LCHFRLHFLALLRDDAANIFTDGGGLDDVVAAVDLGKALAFDAGFRGLRMYVSCGNEGKFRRRTYSITSTKFLLSGDDGSATLGGVESTLAFDGGLSRGTASAGLASNLCDSVPVVHGCDYVCISGVLK